MADPPLEGARRVVTARGSLVVTWISPTRGYPCPTYAKEDALLAKAECAANIRISEADLNLCGDTSGGCNMTGDAGAPLLVLMLFLRLRSM
jgi:hypothetical protein